MAMIQAKLLRQLSSTHDAFEIERHLVFNYLVINKIDYSKSDILNQYLNDFKEIKYLKDSLSADLTLKELENIFELIIPGSDKILNGAFFTPSYIVDFIINELKPNFDAKNLDPSCGSGAFLLGIANYYINFFNKNVKDIVKNNIFGSDILEYNVRRSKILLTLLAISKDEILEDSDFNIICVNSLAHIWPYLFDNVVGNPPYVRFQDLSLDQRQALLTNWQSIQKGSYNLYFAFFELGYNLLKINGQLGYITPNNYFTSLAGESLRSYLKSKLFVKRIIDFDDKKVFDAQTYTAITFAEKSNNTTIQYDRIKKQETPEIFLNHANGSINNLDELDSKKWRLLLKSEITNIRNIEMKGEPLGKLLDISVGIATLKDDIYFIESFEEDSNYLFKISDKGSFKIEKDILKNVYKISEIKNKNDLSNNQKKIIFPYNIINNNAYPISEKEMKEKFPYCYTYLLSEREALQARDKGKVIFNPFYLWGRSQGLTKWGPKILTPTFSKLPRFMFVEDPAAFFTNGYGLFFKPASKPTLFGGDGHPLSIQKNVDVLIKILNSIVMKYYVEKTSVSIAGGYPCYQKNFIERFSIPFLSLDEVNMLRSENNSEKIDDFLILKYDLDRETVLDK